jgi:hypothetical protein
VEKRPVQASAKETVLHLQNLCLMVSVRHLCSLAQCLLQLL